VFVGPSFPSNYAAAVNAITNYAGYTDPPAFQVLRCGAASAMALSRGQPGWLMP